MSRLTERQLAKAYIVEKTIDRTHRYLLDGRHYADLSDSELTAAWIGTLRDLAGTDFSQESQRAEILDIESELGLRGIEMPMDQVQPELALFAKLVERRRREGRPDPADCSEFRAELANLRERLSRPKH